MTGDRGSAGIDLDTVEPAPRSTSIRSMDATGIWVQSTAPAAAAEALAQQAIFAEYRQLRGGTPVSDVSETLEHAFALANQVQLGADVAFDMFYSLGMVVTSHPGASKRRTLRLASDRRTAERRARDE